MNKLKTFWYSFKQSITNTAYYKEIIKTPFSFSVKYFIVLVYFSLLIPIGIYSVQTAFYLPKLPEDLNNIEKRLEALYPSDLIISIENDTVSINQPEPYYIDVPELSDIEEIDHLITFNSEASVSDYSDYKTIILVTDTEVVYPDSQQTGLSSYRVAKVEIDDMKITRMDYNQLMEKASGFFDLAPKVAPWLLILAVILLPLFLALISAGWNFIAVTFFTLITWGISGLFKNGIAYKKLLQMGLHAVTVPIVLSFFLQLVNVTLPLVFMASFLLWMVIILAKYKEVKA